MTDARPLVVAVDQGVDLKALRHLQRERRVVLVQAHDLEQSFRHIGKQGRPFRLDVSALGGIERLAGDNVHEVERIVGKAKLADVDHVYSSWLNGNNYFVTENLDDFIREGRREGLEAALPGLRIRTTEEFLREMRARRVASAAGSRAFGAVRDPCEVAVVTGGDRADQGHVQNGV